MNFGNVDRTRDNWINLGAMTTYVRRMRLSFVRCPPMSSDSGQGRDVFKFGLLFGRQLIMAMLFPSFIVNHIPSAGFKVRWLGR